MKISGFTLDTPVTHTFLRGMMSVIDQGVCSVGNFATVILLSHALAPDRFGAYALVFNTVMVFSSVQNALVTGPLRVLGAPHVGDAWYVRSQWHVQACVLALEVPLLVLALAWFVPDRAALVGAVLAMAAMQINEFARSVISTRLALSQLLVLDVSTNALRIICLAGLFVANELTVWNALAVIGVSSLVSLPFLPWRGPSDSLTATFAENWRLGRWLAADAIAYTLSTRVYLYLVAICLGTSEVAALTASQALVAAANLVIGGLMMVAIPVARLKLSQRGYRAWRSWWMGTASLIAALGAVLFAAVSAFAGELMHLVYPAYFAAFAPLVVVLCLGAWFDAVNTVVVSAMWSAEKPQVNVLGKALSAVFMLAWAFPAINAFGINGAVIGLALTPAIWLLVNLAYLLTGGLGEHRMHRALATATREADS